MWLLQFILKAAIFFYPVRFRTEQPTRRRGPFLFWHHVACAVGIGAAGCLRHGRGDWRHRHGSALVETPPFGTTRRHVNTQT